MANARVGYAVGEAGVVLKTTDGGDNWQLVANHGFPYYYYGCQALDSDTLVVSGFNNTVAANHGFLTWTDDGGRTWSPFIKPGPPSPWLQHVQFIDRNNGMAQSLTGAVFVTANGGRQASDWTHVAASSGWLQGKFTYLQDGRAWLGGYEIVHSTNGGQTWSRLPSASTTFDGSISILPSGKGVVGSGTIAPTIEGWVHRTSDGGMSWSPSPVLRTAWPIRAVAMVDEQTVVVAGGDYFSGGGGIHLSRDGGATWNLEQATGTEMTDIDLVAVAPGQVDVYAAGYGGQIWRTRLSINGGTHSTYGAGCPGSPQRVPELGSFGAPDVGQSFVVTLSGAASSAPAFLALGGSNLRWGGFGLPLQLAAVGAPGCAVLCSYDGLVGVTTDPAGDASYKLRVPNRPALVGACFFDQWIVYDPPANALGFVFSEGGKGTMGRR